MKWHICSSVFFVGGAGVRNVGVEEVGGVRGEEAALLVW